ncbi:4-oxalocrotonate tautomerase family protein [Pseudonocardia sp.]|uniref:tautomerase family protein n=1 Tax=Pseudonocardia sp. TaxID=60912 RepID=UPI0031FD3A15
MQVEPPCARGTSFQRGFTRTGRGEQGGRDMPLIQVTIGRGRTPEQLQALGQALTDAAEKSIGAKRESIRVVLTECEPEHWFVGGETLAELRASGRR